jgi:N-acetylneuraminic acid mutarotase
MHRQCLHALVGLALLLGCSIALASGPMALTASSACPEDAHRTSDWGCVPVSNPEPPGPGGQDVLIWANKAVLPEAVSRTAGCFDLNGLYHQICGNCQIHVSHPYEQVYNPASNSWSQGHHFPGALVGNDTGIHNHDAVAIGNQIYAGGGSRGNSITVFYNKLTVLDLDADTWIEAADMPANNLIYYSLAACNDKIYCFGGTTDNTNILGTTWEYDPGGGGWTAKAAMPAVRRNALTATWGDTIYVMGGFAAMAYNGNNTFWKYCPSTNQWTTAATLPEGIGWGRAVVYNDPGLGPQIYTIAGYNASATVINTVRVYSIRSGTWALETPLLGGRRSHAGWISSDGKIFIAGGWNGSILATTELATAAPAASVDVGISAIRVPGTQVTPGVPINPRCVVRNFGTMAQSNIPVSCTIDSFGTEVYGQNLTITGPLNPGDTGTAFFATAWTPGTSPYYTVTLFTALGGDSVRANDTGRVVATTWVSIAAPADSANRLCHATVYDPIGDKIYMIGGNPAGVSATYLALNQQYDPVANAWTNKAPMPTARGWLKGSYCRGKIYVIGGHNNASVAVATNECYDPSGNSWTTLAARPRAALAALEAVWRDSLIYVMGGTDGTSGLTFVDIYNPFSNTWATGTALPQMADMGGAVCLGDTIYIPEAVNRGTSQCWANLYKGYIDPVDPTSITWIQGPAHGSATSICGATALGGKVYWVGGFLALLTVTNRVWCYDPADGQIYDFPANYPITIARNNNVVGRESASELYVIAGDSGGNWAIPNRKYAKIVVPQAVTCVAESRQAMDVTVLGGIRPNPMTGNALVSYTLGRAGHASLKLYNPAGKLVVTLASGYCNAGATSFTIHPSSLSKGIYLLKLETEGSHQTRKLIVE